MRKDLQKRERKQLQQKAAEAERQKKRITQPRK
jgi:hypothetical protein